MKRIALLLSLVLCAGVLLSACGHQRPMDGYFLLSDLDNAKIGIVEGATEVSEVHESIANANIKKFKNADDAVNALKSKKVTAIILDGFTAQKVLGENKNLGQMIEKLSDKKYYAATFIKDKSQGDDFLLEIDAGITKMKHFNHDEEFYNRYFAEKLPDSSDMIYNVGTKDRVLKVGVAEDNAPFSYRDKDGRYIGFDVEVANEVAKMYKATLEIYPFRREELLKATQEGDMNMVMGRLTDLDDEHENDWMLFSMPYFDASQVVILNKTDVGNIMIPQK